MAWNGPFSGLLEFKQQWAHYDIPQKYAKNPKFRVLVKHYRIQYILLNSGEKSLISDARIAQLEKLGFQWNHKSQLALTMAWIGIFSDQIEFKQQ